MFLSASKDSIGKYNFIYIKMKYLQQSKEYNREKLDIPRNLERYSSGQE